MSTPPWPPCGQVWGHDDRLVALPSSDLHRVLLCQPRLGPAHRRAAALLVLGLLFWDWRRLVVSVAAIAVSLAAAVVVLYLRGDTVNLMMTAGLVLGLTAVVYDAVVDPHRVARRLHEARATNPDQEGRARAWATVVYGSADTRRAVFYAVLISATATIPVFFLRGEGGAFLPDIMLSYLLAMAASMVVAVTLTPVLCLMLMGSAARPVSSPRGCGGCAAATTAWPHGSSEGPLSPSRWPSSPSLVRQHCRSSTRPCGLCSRSGTSSCTWRPRPAPPCRR